MTPKTWKSSSSASPANMSPFSVHQGAKQEPDKVLSTTILANNIHCASCVTHIEEIIERIGQDVLGVSVSIVNHEVHVLHSSSVLPSTICQVLADEAFELSSATTVDKSDNVVSEVSLSSGLDGLLDRYGDPIWQPSLHSLSARFRSSPSYFSFIRSKRNKHVENCIACQANEDLQPRNVEPRLIGPKAENTFSTHEEKGSKYTNGFKNKESTSGALSHDGKVDSEKSMEEQATASRESVPENVKTNTGKTKPLFLLTMSIGGMTCASCTNAVKHALEKIDDVQDVGVNLMTNSASLRYTGDEKLATVLTNTIEDLGYEASVLSLGPAMPPNNIAIIDTSPNHHYRATLSLGGMTCASCSNAILDGLKELPFVDTADITLMTNSATVVFKDRRNSDTIVGRVEDLGYDCSLESLEELDSSQDDAPQLSSRTIQVSISGMFCENCPRLVVQKLGSVFHSNIRMDESPSLKKPVTTISYTPAKDLTIRNIISAMNSVNSNFNIRVYHAPSIEDRSQQLQFKERKKILLRLLLCTIIVIPTFLVGIVWMSLVSEMDSTRQFLEESLWAGNVSRAEWALFILATPVYLFAANTFHLRAIKEIRALWRKDSKFPILRRFYRFGSMNLLISAGTTVAFVSSTAILIVNATTTNYSANGTYFDSVVFLTFFILIGRYLEAYSKSKTGNAVAMLGNLRPQEALLIVPEPLPSNEEVSSQDSFTSPTKIETISTDLLEIGDHVIVPHGSSPPTDGTLVTEKGQFDESSLTGESRPVKKVIGDAVFVGTINTGNPITMEITKLGGTSMLDQIVSVVREGQTKRAPIERFADMLTGYFVPVITALAIITFFIWFGLGQSGMLSPTYLGNGAGGWAFWSLEFAIAVFVVACPCGIGLAAPTALFVGGGLAAKHGILVRGGGEAFQEAGSLDAIVFDKTGTLTEGGDLRVTEHEILVDASMKGNVWAIIQSLESLSSHPIAKAILGFASTESKSSIRAESVSEVAGLGVRGTFALSPESSSVSTILSYEAAIGSEALIYSLAPTLLEDNMFASQSLSTWKTQAKSVAILAIRPVASPESSWTIAALFATTDPIRPSALPTIKALQKRKIAVYMLSGDNPTTANAVATSLSIPIANVFAGVLPTQKAEKISWLQENLSSESSSRSSLFSKLFKKQKGNENSSPSSSPAKVAFVGDGINDAPALLAATVSISPSTGSPIALTSSSFVLMSSSLTTIITLLDLSDRVFQRVRTNFAWALVYNVTLVPVAAGILFKVREEGWRLGPVWSAAAMAGSSVSVVLSSLALRWEGGWMSWRTKGKHEGREERNEK